MEDGNSKPLGTPKHLLMEAEYVAWLRPKCRDHAIDGLVEGTADPIANSLGFALIEAEWIVSPGGQQALTKDELWEATIRHGLADWGEVDQATAETNFLALEKGGELKSAFHTLSGIRFQIITNAERTCHSIHLENEQPLWMTATPNPDQEVEI